MKTALPYPRSRSSACSTSPSPRGRPRSARADSAIAAATIDLLGQFGYGELTMAGVAARAGVSTATLYRRFASKEELVVSALETLIEVQAPSDTGTLRGDVRETFRRLVSRMTPERRLLFLSLAAEMGTHPELGEAARERLLAPLRIQIEHILDRAALRAEIPPVSDAGVAVSVFCGPLLYRMLVTGETADDEVVDQLVPYVCAALGAKADS